MRLLLLVCAGGALGAGLRYMVYVLVGRLIGMGSPYAGAAATLAVNVIGSLAMGAIIEAIALKYAGSLDVRAFLVTGILGGFTTFSAFSMDAVYLIQRGETALAGIYVGASVAVSILALLAGLSVTRIILT